MPKTLKKPIIDLEQTIMEKVKSNEISMKPKWYFVFGSILMTAGLMAFSIAAVFLTNLTLFFLRQHGPNGQYRLEQLLNSFPWWVPVLAIAGIILGLLMLKRYDFSYKNNFWLVICGFIIAIILAGFTIDQLGLNDIWSRQGPMRRFYQCLSDDCLKSQDLNVPAAKLPKSVENALNEAINDEYKAFSTYEAVIKKFGQTRPFSMIKGAEEQHIASLKSIYDKYGLKIPENNWLAKVSVPDTLQQSCQTGVEAEIANAALYREKLLPQVKDYEDITLVFTNLMNASQQKHLPAFERCN